MKKEQKTIPDFDDIVFELRNKGYGAYVLRRNYSRNVVIALLTGTLIISAAVITPYLNAKSMENRKSQAERIVAIKMENLDQPDNMVIPPPPPPPPPADVVQQQKYIPPVVVDSVKPEDNVQLMTADEAQVEVKNTEVVEAVQEVKEEIQEEETVAQPFVIVEEMPEPQGGTAGLLKFIADNLRYPDDARENNIQGRVFVKFCVTSKGGIDLVAITKGVDPQLDAEAIRVVKTLPAFKPGRQGGKAVPVWFTVPINFRLLQN